MRTKLQPRREDEHPGLTDRLLAAFLAPVVFNISNLIMVGVLFRRSSPGFGRFLVQDVPKLGSFLLWALLLIPALVGLLIGMDRLIALIGHLFYTHTENERNQAITIAAWVCLLLAAFLLSRAM
jgi:hypothetical protein